MEMEMRIAAKKIGMRIKTTKRESYIGNNSGRKSRKLIKRNYDIDFFGHT